MHLLRCLQIVLVTLEAAGSSRPERTGLNAEQHVMGVVLGSLGVMGVVGGKEGAPVRDEISRRSGMIARCAAARGPGSR